ncbi:hypothetical protein B0H66DRAFT_554817 [Apodospora peruviana]|uniref:Flavin reductase like domain-containing protein n=1 Tax=Apodospora peruviana TaxID=516989 RepID=A0AAE0M8B4_9PEZI|nr:hypothetical protein B0H66DRAFT_554817 [Apodospora peruviana]
MLRQSFRTTPLLLQRRSRPAISPPLTNNIITHQNKVYLSPPQRPLSSSPKTSCVATSSSPKYNSPKMAGQQQAATAAFEKEIKRNPHPDFKQVEASRPAFDSSLSSLKYTQTASPSWTFGSGANSLSPSPSGQHITIDPYAPGRPAGFNYKLLISAIIPRPIAFLSTHSPSNGSTNLAPFSYFQMIGHDPPLFVIGFAGATQKDSLRNLVETNECVINVISEHFVEAANSTSINAPYGTSEWDISGLTPVYDCETVKAARVKEAVFSVEGKLESVREFESRTNPGKVSSTMVVIEGKRFWVREDAVNEERNMLDPDVLRPIARLGGITYARLGEAFEIPRPDFEKHLGGVEGMKKLKEKSKDSLPN